MTVNVYVCDDCHKEFSHVHIEKDKSIEMALVCPFCGSDVLILLHREVSPREKKISRVGDVYGMEDE